MKRKNSNLLIMASVALFALTMFAILTGTFQKVEDWFVGLNTQEFNRENATSTPEQIIIPEKEAWKDELRETDAFKTQIEDELEKRYWMEMDRKAGEELLKLQDKGFSGEQVSAVRAYLNEQGSDLALYADKIVGHPRWVEALAITGKETSFCMRGVGNSKNNCGAIKGGSGFRAYPTEYEGFLAVVELLQKDLYADKTIAEMNGTYCVYEEGPTGVGECPNWTEVIEKFIGDIHLAMI